MNFHLEYPKIKDGSEIEAKSLETIETECLSIQRFKEFDIDSREIIKRLIHATTSFDQIIHNIQFINNPIPKIKELLKNSATIIVDTNMIKSGMSDLYTKKYNNNIVCHVNDQDIHEESKKLGVTRTYLAVKKALERHENDPVILACGNAPTFIYSAIETLVQINKDINSFALLAFPVGFVNVVESKDYAIKYLSHFNSSGIVLKGRYGASTMIVSCLHAIYKLI